MRILNRYRLWFLAGSALFSVAASVRAVWLNLDGPARGAHIVCDVPVFDFGEVRSGQQVEHTFLIRNDGPTPLEITRVRPDCACVVSKLPGTTIAPGGSMPLTATVSLKNRRGPQRKSILVQSDDPKRPQLLLYIQGAALSDFEVEPARLALGTIEPDSALELTVDFTAKAGGVRGVRAETGSPHLTVRQETVEGGKSIRLRVATKTPLPIGPLQGRIRVLTGSQIEPEVSIPVTAVVAGALRVEPQRIALLKGGTVGLARTIYLRAGKAQGFAVKKVELPSASARAQVVALAGGGYRIELTNLLAGELDGKAVRITTDVRGMEEIIVPIHALKFDPATAPRPKRE